MLTTIYITVLLFALILAAHVRYKNAHLSLNVYSLAVLWPVSLILIILDLISSIAKEVYNE